MSMDQHPDVSNDDSGIVPQNAPRADWPKKIRTLSAAELDRLTIDGEGRFYWDGHLVNYQPPQPAQAPQPAQPEAPAAQAQPTQMVDLDALALLDRAARELSGHPPTDIAPNTTATPDAAPQAVTGEIRSPDAQTPVAPAANSVATVAQVSQVAPMSIIDMPLRAPNENVRLRMSFWQSVGLFVVVIGLLIGAVGIAISGLVAAHDWGCRNNLVKQYCPPPPPEPKAPARIDIPA